MVLGSQMFSTFRICVQPCGQVPQNPENNQWLGLRGKTKEMVYGLEEQERLRDGLATENGAAEADKSCCQRVNHAVRFLASRQILAVGTRIHL